jgi:phosphoribosylformylglycinamidine synthase
MQRIEIRRKNDPRGDFVRQEFLSLGIAGIVRVEVRDVYYLDPDLDRSSLHRAARELLCDPVTEKYRLGPGSGFEVLYNPGVTDPREASIRKALADIGIRTGTIRTATDYRIRGRCRPDQVLAYAALFLYNPLIQHIKYRNEKVPESRRYRLKIHRIPLDGDLERLSRDMGLSLSRLEMTTIKEYYDRTGRNPTDVELETIAQTWSEHCRHKTFLGKIDFEGRVIDNLLKNTIMKATREIDHPLCLSVFHDNSGVIDFDRDFGVCFKVETHNHPSALEPYGGAATGIGGVIRDIMGTGLGAKPIMNTDVFCFGPPRLALKKLPAGLLHPQRIIKGVIQGVRDYGNRMGIPTPSGAIYFDRDFLYNPLIFCGCVGLIRKDRIHKAARPGDLVLLVGGRTGRDGIHGATFSSAELSSASEKSCVQIGNPIVEKRVLDCLLKVTELGIASAVTDCGGGGLSSAVGEMGKQTGVRVRLEKVPLKYEGLTPREIWISESQERMLLAVPSRHLARVIGIFEAENVEAVTIGVFTDDRRLRLDYRGRRVADLDMDFLHDGLPMPRKKAVRRKPYATDPAIPSPRTLGQTLLKLVGRLNCRSREWVIREYDHEVQGASALKPLVGRDLTGPQDAVMIKPRLDSNRGIVISCGINPAYGKYDAYRMALSAVDEALRNLVCAGGDIGRTAVLDNFCFASPDRPEVLGDIVLASQGAYAAARAFGVPFISGKDSLNNEWTDDAGQRHPIPATLLVSAMGIIDDVGKGLTMDLKKAGHDLYLIGWTKPEFGGSEYLSMLGIKGGLVPDVDLLIAPRIMKAMNRAMKRSLIESCHDLSEGGLGLTIAEMAFSGGVGAEIDLDLVPYRDGKPRPDLVLFAESNTRFLVEVEPGRAKAFKKICAGLPCAKIGRTTSGVSLVIKNRRRKVLDLPLRRLRRAWLRKVV